MKKLKYLLFILFISFFGILNVNAFSITGSSSVTVGSSISVKIEASGLIGRFDVSSSDNSVLSGGKSLWLENNTTTLSFKANKAGSVSITVNATDVSDEAGNTFTGKRILYVTVKEKSSSSNSGSTNNNKKPSVDVNKKYSSNNYLSSLSIEGYELTPQFNKDTLEYNVDLKVDTTKVNVTASVEDSKATVKGVGEINVNEGANTIVVTAIAENGNERQYKINATVLVPDPINVEIDNKKYTVVRKKGQIENIPLGFVESSVKISDQDIAAYKSDVTNLLLVVLKDDKGTLELFIYDSSKNSYQKFNEVKGTNTNLLILEKKDEKVPDGFINTTFKINDKTVNGYKLKEAKDQNYYLVYAQNLETGKNDFYLYDTKDGTFQRYYDDISKIKDEQIKYLFYIASGLLGILGLIILIKLSKKIFVSKEKKIIKYQKKIDKLKSKINKYENSSYDLDELYEKPIIKQVEEDEYIVPKKSRKEKLREINEAKKRLDESKLSYRRISLEDDID